MAVRFQIPRYTTRDIPILVGTMLPMTILLNYFLYGHRYFRHGGMFIAVTLVTFTILAFAYLTYGFVAVSLRNRYPLNRQTFKRLSICLSIFFLMSLLYISLVLTSYDNMHFFGYQYSDRTFYTAFISFVVINIFLTFLNEGVYRFEKYRSTITETEQLKKVYMHSQLLGLKSQMNPHFLFNSLNTLSSLINEDADKAEDFLDHMSKVYRYLLRNNEEQLVTIETELSFIRSYYYLLRARHAEGLQIDIHVSAAVRHQQIPPLTLQMIIENTITQNSVTRNKPLLISIRSADDMLVVENNVQYKMNFSEDCCEVLENIANKFRLLCQQDIEIKETEKQRQIFLPLIPEKEMIEI